MDKNVPKPMPTKGEKAELAAATGMTKVSVFSFFLHCSFMHMTQKVVFIAKPQPTDTPLNMTSHRFSQDQVSRWFYNAHKRSLYKVDPLQSTIQLPVVESCVKDKRKSDKSTAEEPGKRRRSRSDPTHSLSSPFLHPKTCV